MDRSFKGIWIPSEIWLCESLTMQEKLFLVEIDSLDNSQGCFASNAYFADFFGLSKNRVSSILTELAEKGFVQSTLEYYPGTKQIQKRVLNICRPPYPIGGFTPSENCDTPPSENCDTLPPKTVIPPSENCEGNNIAYNKEEYKDLIPANAGKSVYSIDFEIFWKAYPNRKEKKAAYIEWKKICKEPNILETCLLAIDKQRNSKEWLKDDGQFIPYPSRWIKGRRWEDEVQKTPPTRRTTNFAN